jgi:hypothetical protein
MTIEEKYIFPSSQQETQVNQKVLEIVCTYIQPFKNY